MLQPVASPLPHVWEYCVLERGFEESSARGTKKKAILIRLSLPWVELIWKNVIKNRYYYLSLEIIILAQNMRSVLELH